MQTVTSDFRMAVMHLTVGWKSAIIRHGEQFVMNPGMSVMLLLLARRWDIVMLVSFQEGEVRSIYVCVKT